MKHYLFCAGFINALTVSAQPDSAKTSHHLTFAGYLEVYYQYDFNKPVDHNRSSFIYSYNRTNEVNINLAFAKATYVTEKTRANLALIAGTYANSNLASEPGVFKNIFEANIGVKLSKKKSFWLDAGIMPSHIGFESAIGKDCWTLTRSILADNSPYYETGVKTSYTSPNAKWYLAALILNGWQHIYQPNGNNTPAFGTQITFTFERLTLNSSTFIGNDKPDSIKQMRYFHNFYAIWQMSKKIGVILGLDAGIQRKNKSDGVNTWYSPLIILRYQPSDNWAIGARAEYYRDKNGVIVQLMNAQPFKMKGFSFNIDHNFNHNLLWRTEAKIFRNSSPYFVKANGLSKTEASLAASLIFFLTNAHPKGS